MNGVWRRMSVILTGISVTAMYATAQYTISARPGVVNYIEGDVSLNGASLEAKQLRNAYTKSNDSLSTGAGKAEILLSPGIYLRVGDNSEIRMISPSLVHSQFEVVKGEAIVEIAEIEKGSDIVVVDHGASITLQRNGLYRFTGDTPPMASAIEGKADVAFGERTMELNKGHEVVLTADLKPEKFDTKREDDLYAWSNVRDQYDAAASLQTARNINTSTYGGGWYGYGFDGWYSPGWVWNGMFGSYAWLPGITSAFYSPFGYGFYGPGVVGYAPIIYVPGYVGGGSGYVKGKQPITAGSSQTPAKATTMAVAVNPERPPAIGMASAASPFANSVARTEMARTFASTGYSTVSGAHVSVASASAGSGSSGSGSGGHAASFSSAGFSGGGHGGGGGGHH